MTRSHKYNDKDHSAEAAASPAEPLMPKFFGKNGFEGCDPKAYKKNGGGKGNWGPVGDEVNEEDGFHFTKARRRSNSSAAIMDSSHFKTKFEVNEPEPFFEEGIHGPVNEELSHVDTLSSDGNMAEDTQH